MRAPAAILEQQKLKSSLILDEVDLINFLNHLDKAIPGDHVAIALEPRCLIIYFNIIHELFQKFSSGASFSHLRDHVTLPMSHKHKIC